MHLSGHLLHPRFVGPRVSVIEQADRRRVAAERPVGERIDDPEPHRPTLSSALDSPWAPAGTSTRCRVLCPTPMLRLGYCPHVSGTRAATDRGTGRGRANQR